MSSELSLGAGAEWLSSTTLNNNNTTNGQDSSSGANSGLDSVNNHHQAQASPPPPGVPSAALNNAIDAAGASAPHAGNNNSNTNTARLAPLNNNTQQQQKHLLLSPHVPGLSGPGSASGPAAAAASLTSLSTNKQDSSMALANSNINGSIATGLSIQQHNNNAGTGGANTTIPPSSGPPAGINENEKVYWLIVELLNPTTREAALLELSKKREQWDDLALVLWHSFGVMSALLQEIVSVYPLLSPASLTAGASNRVCNALALLQCVASHNDTRGLFLQAHVPLFLYPFLNTTSKTRPFEYLRLTSLGVIGALVKQNDNSDVINFLLSTEIIPLCLRIMETGSELSKTVAIFIVQKILLDEMGLAYICQTYERFYAVGTVLSNMVQQLVETQAVRLLKHVVRCYLRLSDNLRAREALRACLPEELRNATFSHLLKGDLVTKRCLASLLLALSDRVDG